MANSNANTGKKKELQEIVFDMILKGEKKEEILLTLQETGLSKEESEEVYEKVEEDYEESLGTKLEARVKSLFRENEEEMMQRMDKKLKKFKKDMRTKRNLKESEQKEYVNREIKKLEERINELQSHLFTFRATTEDRIKEIGKKFGESGPTQIIKKTVSIIIILIALTIITYPIITFETTKILLEQELSKGIINILLQAAMILGGLLLAKFGKDIYTASQKEKLKEVGQEWIEK